MHGAVGPLPLAVLPERERGRNERLSLPLTDNLAIIKLELGGRVAGLFSRIHDVHLVLLQVSVCMGAKEIGHMGARRVVAQHPAHGIPLGDGARVQAVGE